MDVHEYQLLLDLSRAITMVRDADALLRVMMEQVRPLFGFDDAGILVLDAAGEQHRDLLVGHPSVLPTEATRRLAAAGLGGWLPHKGSMIEAHMHACRAANGPLVFAFDELLRAFPAYPFHALINDLGYQEVLVTLLRVRGDSVGLLYLISTEHGRFCPQQFALFEAIADQIAIAVRNIEAHEALTTLAEERRLRADVLAKANDALKQAAEDLAVARTVEDIYGVFLRQAAAISDATGGAVLQRSGPSSTRFEFVALLDEGEVLLGERLHGLAMVAAMPERSEHDTTGYFARLAQGHTLIVPVDERIFPEGMAWNRARGNQAIWAIPFTLHGNVQGYLRLPLRDERAPSSVVREALKALASQIAVALEVVRLANLPLRPPAVLAKAAASLDHLSGGRVELGLGAGGFWDAIAAYGGPRRAPGAALAALDEAITVIRKVWSGERNLQFAGEHYQLNGAQSGPVPAHPIGIWLGVYGPRALQLAARAADGWIPSFRGDLGPIVEMTARLDEAAVAAGRDPASIRRVLNVGGEITAGASQGTFRGPVEQWVDEVSDLALTHGFDTFVLWAEGEEQLGRFAEEVVPAVREQIAAARG